MNPEILARLRGLCRDEEAFEDIKQIVGGEIQRLKQEINQAYFRVEEQKTLFRVITCLRESIDLETIFQATATEVRQLLQADRVGMFRFYQDSGWDDGEFVSEDVDPAFVSAMGQKIHDHCFGEQFAIHYHQGRVQAVADIYSYGLSDCHIQILSQFQIRANLVVPLLQGQKLWGLLCINQCSATREWQATEIEFVSQIANHLGVALKHAELLAELQAEVLERQQVQQAVQSLNQGLQRAIIELQAVNKELEAFCYSVSHDLRTPLRSIDGFSQALLEDYLDRMDETGQDFLWRIRAGNPKSILTVSTDITEKKQLQAQFLRAQRLESIGTLASGIAHDFNNILTPILAVAQLLPIKFTNLDDKSQQLLEILEGSAKRGADLVKQIQ